MATYPMINGTAMGSDLSYLLVYTNTITHGMAVPMMVLSFFLIVLIGSLIMQQRFTGNMRFETSLMAASFTTLGLATILEQTTGLLSAGYFIILIGITILSFILLALSSSD
jgi:hypothetical protein